MRFFDRIQINSKNVTTTDEGYLVIPANFARTGIYDYTGNGYGHLYRDPKVVFDSESMSTLLGKSLTITHPEEAVNPENWKDLEVGQVLSVDADKESKFLQGNLIIKDKKAIEFVQNSINKGKSIELSCGYNAHITDNTGTFEGKDYDGTQENIRYNHIALVPKGRAGSEVKLLIDSMTETKRMKVKFNDTYIEVDDKDVKIIEDAEKAFQAEKAKVAQLEADKKVLDAEKKALNDENEELKKNAVTDAQIEEMAKEVSEVNLLMDSLGLEKKESLKENKVAIIDHYLKDLKIKDEEDEKVFDTAWKSAKIMADGAVKANKDKTGTVIASVEDAEFEDE